MFFTYTGEIMLQDQETHSMGKVTRIRSAGHSETTTILQDESTQPMWRGFGSVRGETLDQFHDRMFEIPPLEAMIYEMEVALST